MSVKRWSLGFALISVALFAAMQFISIPVIGHGLGSDQMFDMLPFGYDFAYAQRFISNLSPQGLEMYLGPQNLIDTAFPVSLGLTFIFLAKWLAKSPAGFAITALLAVAYILCDLYENSLVADMLSTNDLTTALVTRASRSTIFKFALLAATALSVLIHAFKRQASKIQSYKTP